MTDWKRNKPHPCVLLHLRGFTKYYTHAKPVTPLLWKIWLNGFILLIQIIPLHFVYFFKDHVMLLLSYNQQPAGTEESTFPLKQNCLLLRCPTEPTAVSTLTLFQRQIKTATKYFKSSNKNEDFVCLFSVFFHTLWCFEWLKAPYSQEAGLRYKV